ncbi:acyl-CoA dehydrogenase family protein [Litoribrevibacter euphylliae]|uniref:Acyl-CoA dehydrogenase family protein n=1 Tax=Litoribrevibacter euphylliae TaxID=1834034 RepID=A0ABV7HIR6_9GAMM
MNFDLSDTQLMIQQTAKKFAESELFPVASTVEDKAQRPLFLANLKKLAELGFMGLNIDSQYGGTEAGTIAFSLAMTEIAKGCASTAVTMSVNNMVAEVIQSIGSEEQKQRYLSKICSGEFSAGAFCLTEAGAGSDPAAMSTKAVKYGDHWIINGTKLYITSAAYAGVFVVWAVTDSSAPKGKGITCFLVDADNPGVSISKEEQKMGQLASATNEVVFTDCKVPATAMLGALNQGFKIAVSELAGGRIGIGSLALGLGEKAIELAIDHVKERQQFGQSIADFQGVQWMLAEAKTDMEAARLLLLKAAFEKEQGRPFGPQASMAKWFATEKANQACYTAQQLFGGQGYLKDSPIERLVRDVRVTSIYEGTSEIQKVIISRDVLNE